MPLTVETALSPLLPVSTRERRLRRGAFADRGRRIEVGLVNNMPAGAVAATQRQFASLLEAGSGEFDVRLNLFDLETLPRSRETRRAMAEEYSTARALTGGRQDAMIVTGAEPHADDLREEPFWNELGFVLDWADAHALSTLHSCLAAHAAVLRRDAIARRRFAAKCSGVFAVDVVADHELTAGLAQQFRVPHSRWNGLDEGALAAKGYVTLTRSETCGVDLFIRNARSLLVFLQGHPEYDADTLAREHRRDTLRFLRGETAAPAMPVNYFPPATEAAVADYVARARALSARPSQYPAAALALDVAPWRESGVRLARNWLKIVAQRKAARNLTSFAVVRWGG
ncbi:MAG: homoserine O-succinyltransferase [Bradyrhizobium sp.]|nr:MAG: homoserine O-succinyltransferase [Bradyrhizobium sp.]